MPTEKQIPRANPALGMTVALSEMTKRDNAPMKSIGARADTVGPYMDLAPFEAAG
jgi:hypothetical protein